MNFDIIISVFIEIARIVKIRDRIKESGRPKKERGQIEKWPIFVAEVTKKFGKLPHFQPKMLIFHIFGGFVAKSCQIGQIWQDRKLTKPSDTAFKSIPGKYELFIFD